MHNYLPRVKREIAASMSVNMDGILDDKKFLKQELKEIKKANPIIAEFIWKYSKTVPKAKMHAIYCGIMVYKLLHSQSEADAMNQDLI